MTDKNCTFCHWYNWKTRSCYHGYSVKEDDIAAAIENAPIREAVEEGFSDAMFNQLKMNLESKLSKKQAQRIMHEFYEELDDIKIDWIEAITDGVISAVVNHCGKEGETIVRIAEPKDFYCKHFM